MSTTTPTASRHSPFADQIDVSPARADDLLSYLGSEHCFPADREDLLERGIGRHAPPAVLQVILALPTGRSWPHPEAVLHELGLAPPRLTKPPRLLHPSSR